MTLGEATHAKKNSEALGGYKRGDMRQANGRAGLPSEEEARRKRFEAVTGLRLHFVKIIT